MRKFTYTYNSKIERWVDRQTDLPKEVVEEMDGVEQKTFLQSQETQKL